MHKCPCINVLNVDTWKTRDPNFEGGSFEIFPYDGYLQNCSHFSIFFIMADTDIPFLLTLGKLETQTFGDSVI